ncbi:MAG: hypothetical protein RI637_01025 [Acidimicrobiia bacterium]|nr:hypothetical protein [Acidimicrobiia bacterium]
MKRFLAATAFLVVAVGVIAISTSASAKDSILTSFTSNYPATAGSALDSCSTCHTSVPALNAYGSALQAAGLNFRTIEGLDSDGDGFTNLQEIRALTNPGVASSRPTTPTSTSTTSSTTSTTSAATPSTSSTTSTTAAAATQPATAALTPAVGPSGSTAFEVKEVGTVWLAIEEGRLLVTRVDTTWQYSQESDGHEVEIKFRSGNQEVEFEAELEDGAIRTEIEVGSDDDRDDDRDHGNDDGRHDDDDDDDHGDDHHGDGKDDDDDHDDD